MLRIGWDQGLKSWSPELSLSLFLSVHLSALFNLWLDWPVGLILFVVHLFSHGDSEMATGSSSWCFLRTQGIFFTDLTEDSQGRIRLAPLPSPNSSLRLESGLRARVINLPLGSGGGDRGGISAV